MSGDSLTAETVAELERVETEAWIDLFNASPAGLRQGLGIASYRIDDGVALVCRKLDHIQFDRLAGLGVVQPARAEALDRAIAAYDKAGVKNWIVQVARGADALRGLCEARGLTPHPRTWAKFIRGTERAQPRTDLTLREIDPGEASAFGSVVAGGFGMPLVAGQWTSALVGRPKWRCFMAFDEATPVSAGALYIDGASAWLGIGATLASHRGRGAQSSMLAARINAAIDAGCSLITTETGMPHPGEAAPSFNNIQRAGFRVAYPRPNYRRA